MKHELAFFTKDAERERNERKERVENRRETQKDKQAAPHQPQRSRSPPHPLRGVVLSNPARVFDFDLVSSRLRMSCLAATASC